MVTGFLQGCWLIIYILYKFEVEHKTSDSDGVETRELKCTICNHEDFEKDVILTHNDIMEQITDEIEDGENENNISFQMIVSVDTIESQLG